MDPKITPDELIAYTTFPEVEERSPELLQEDIIEATAEVERVVGHDFSDASKYPNGVPEPARIAYLKMAQFFALMNQDENVVKGILNEKVGNYTVQRADGSQEHYPPIEHLVSAYIEEENTGGVTLRMGLF